MALTNAFYAAVQSGNVKRVRIMMKDSLIIDPSCTEFREMEAVAKKSLPDLYEAFNGEALKMDKSLWDENLLNMQLVKLINNFSEERVAYLKQVVKYLYPNAKPKVTATDIGAGKPSSRIVTGSSSREGRRPSVNLSYEQRKRRDMRNGSFVKERFAAGAVVGAIVGGAVAAAVEAPIVAGVVVGGVVCGVATVAVLNKR